MKNVAKFLVNSILAGLMIAIGGTVFLSIENKIVGATLFAIGLFIIVTKQLNLFTGKVGYIFNNSPKYLVEVFTTLIGNFIGTFFVGNLLKLTRIYEGISIKAVNICMTKLNDNLLSILVLSIFCGILMYLAVNGYKESKDTFSKYASVFLGVIVFILCGFEHSIANMYYFTVAGLWSTKTIIYVLVMVLGNSIGGVLFPLCDKLKDFNTSKDEENFCKIIVEVGSTCTKVSKVQRDDVETLEGRTIQFKKHYLEDKDLRKEDVDILVESINELKGITNDIYVCGTSIFRSLEGAQKKEFLDYFKEKTGLDFNIISQDKENELTVYGTTKSMNKKACVFIGGGGSTEIAIYDKQIKERANSNIGVIDIMEKFPDLADDLASTDLEEVKEYIKQRLNLPKEKSDILILAGGGHEKFARQSGIRYKKNTLYKDKSAPIMMNIETRKIDTKRYFEEISLDDVRAKSTDKDWWYATRAMTAFVLVVAEEIGAKYIVPTDINMIYGILENDKNNK